MSPEEHSNAVHNYLIYSIMALQKSAKKKLLKRMTDALHKLATSTEKEPLQRVPVDTNTTQTSQVQRVSQEPLITTPTNPTAKAILKKKQWTHLRTTKNNKPGAVPLIPVHGKTARRQIPSILGSMTQSNCLWYPPNRIHCGYHISITPTLFTKKQSIL